MGRPSKYPAENCECAVRMMVEVRPQLLAAAGSNHRGGMVASGMKRMSHLSQPAYRDLNRYSLGCLIPRPGKSGTSAAAKLLASVTTNSSWTSASSHSDSEPPPLCTVSLGVNHGQRHPMPDNSGHCELREVKKHMSAR